MLTPHVAWVLFEQLDFFRIYWGNCSATLGTPVANAVLAVHQSNYQSINWSPAQQLIRVTPIVFQADFFSLIPFLISWALQFGQSYLWFRPAHNSMFGSKHSRRCFALRFLKVSFRSENKHVQTTTRREILFAHDIHVLFVKKTPTKMIGEMIGTKMIGGRRKNSPAKMIGEMNVHFGGNSILKTQKSVFWGHNDRSF